MAIDGKKENVADAARPSISVKLATGAVAFVQFALAYLVALPLFLLYKLARTLLRRGAQLPPGSP